MMQDNDLQLEGHDEDLGIEYNYGRQSKNDSENDREKKYFDEMDENTTPITGLQLALLTVTTSIGGILSGYHLAIISPALPSIAHSLALSSSQTESVVAILYLGGVLGSIFSGPQCDYWGRKPTILYTALVFILGSLIVVLSKGYAGVMWGRFFIGVAIATSLVANVAYLTEMATAKYRGAVVSANELCLCLGFFFAYFIGYNVTYEEQLTAPAGTSEQTKEEIQYKYMFGVTILWAILQFLVMAIYLPESEAWLHQRHQRQYQQAIHFNPRKWYHYKTWLHWWTEGILTHPETIDDSDENSNTGSISNHNEHHLTLYNDEIKEPLASTQFYKYTFMTLIVLATSEQLCGHNVILNFIPEMYVEALNLNEGDAATFMPAIFLGLIKMFVTAYAVAEVDTIGRRSLLLAGVGTMCISHILLMASFSNHAAPSILQVVIFENKDRDSDFINDNNAQKVLLTLGTCGLVIGFALSFGPITHLVTAELFPTNIRGRVLALYSILTFSTGFVVNYTFLSGQEIFGTLAPFVAYFFNTLSAAAFVFLAVPETMGCSLEGLGISLNPIIMERVKEMWLWQYFSNKPRRDFIATITSSLDRYDDIEDDEYLSTKSSAEAKENIGSNRGFHRNQFLDEESKGQNTPPHTPKVKEEKDSSPVLLQMDDINNYEIVDNSDFSGKDFLVDLNEKKMTLLQDLESNNVVINDPNSGIVEKASIGGTANTTTMTLLEELESSMIADDQNLTNKSNESTTIMEDYESHAEATGLLGNLENNGNEGNTADDDTDSLSRIHSTANDVLLSSQNRAQVPVSLLDDDLENAEKEDDGMLETWGTFS